MFRNSKTARILAVLLLAVLLPGSLAAAGWPASAASSWSLGALWGSAVRAACAALGSACPLAQAAASGSDRGCMIDPDGRCAPAATAAASGSDKGCMVDPNGRCAP